MMKYFKNIKTLEELKKEYKKMCFELHPDRNHDRDTTEDFQNMQNEYEEIFEKVKNNFTNSKGEIYTKENTEEAKEFEEILEKIIHMQNVNIEIIGDWLWISGNTKEYKEILKNLKFRWSKNKGAWYYHRGYYRKLSKYNYTLDELRDRFKTEKINNEMAVAIE